MSTACSAPASLLLRISIAGARVRARVRVRIRARVRAKVGVKPASVVYVRVKVRAKIRVNPAGVCIKEGGRRHGVVGLVEGLLLLDLLLLDFLLHLLRVGKTRRVYVRPWVCV